MSAMTLPPLRPRSLRPVHPPAVAHNDPALCIRDPHVLSKAVKDHPPGVQAPGREFSALRLFIVLVRQPKEFKR